MKPVTPKQGSRYICRAIEVYRLYYYRDNPWQDRNRENKSTNLSIFTLFSFSLNMSEVPTTPITGKEASWAIVPAPQQPVLTHNATRSLPTLGSIPKMYPQASATYDDVAQSSDLFWEKLKEFHNSIRTKFM